MSKSKPKIIAIGGMIGAGKSTLINELKEDKYFAKNSVFVDEFRRDDNLFNSLLTAVYEGVEGVEFAFQSYIIQKHHELLTLKYEEACKRNKKYVIIDRYLCEHWLFAQHNLAHDNVLLQTYNCMYHSYMVNSDLKPDLYMCLPQFNDMEEFKGRIINRGRAMEVDNLEANMEYFADLNDDYNTKLLAQCIIQGILCTNFRHLPSVDDFKKELDYYDCL